MFAREVGAERVFSAFERARRRRGDKALAVVGHVA
jgi:hypothetical protein